MWLVLLQWPQPMGIGRPAAAAAVAIAVTGAILWNGGILAQAGETIAAAHRLTLQQVNSLAHIGCVCGEHAYSGMLSRHCSAGHVSTFPL